MTDFLRIQIDTGYHDLSHSQSFLVTFFNGVLQLI